MHKRLFCAACALLLLPGFALGQATAQPAPPDPAPAGLAVPADPVLTTPAPLPLPLPEIAPTPRPVPAEVLLADQKVFTIRAAVAAFSPADRAAAASRRLAQLSKDLPTSPDCVTAFERESETDIVCGDQTLTTVTNTDADFDELGRTRQALAAVRVQAIRTAVIKARNESSYQSLSLGALKAAVATLVLIVILFILHLLFPRFYRIIEGKRGTHIRTIKIQSLELLTEERITDILVQLARLLRLAVTVLLLYFFIPLVFSFFAATRSFGFTLISYVSAPIAAGWSALIAYLPRLLVVLVIVFFAHQAHKLARFLFREVERGTIVWPGFYPEWAMPTHRIVELLILAFSIVVAFPYLPGSNSAAFRGVSIFLGVLFSLGSSSAIANVVAGVLLTYTRAFRIGDRVQIADTVGDVIEKTLLATHIRTIKNVDVTVPNALVLSSHIVNFSRSSAAEPLILNTRITLGYDIPWPQVHQLLTTAATRTAGVLSHPAPFVLQTALDDFYVSYEINACTAEPAQMSIIYSDLYRNILDGFNEAGVEIMSPHYTALRTDGATTVPEPYLTRNERQAERQEQHAAARHPHVHPMS